MRPSLDAWTVIGYVALLGTLILTGPGVRATRAEDPAVSVAPIETEGPTCSAASPIDESEQIAAFTRALREQAAAREAAGHEMPVALNGRGYNYGPGGADFAAKLARQLDQIRQEQR